MYERTNSIGSTSRFKRGLFIAIQIIGLIAVTSSHAETDDSIHFLETKSPSLMDYGQFQLQVTLQNFLLFEGGARPLINVYRKPTEKILVISAAPLRRAATSQKEAQRWCRFFIADVRKSLGIEPKTGLPNTKHSRLALYFLSGASDLDEMPASLSSDLDNMTEIRVEVPDTNGNVTECSGKLLGKETCFKQ